MQCTGSKSYLTPVSEAYNFTSTGEGTYTFEARNLFYVVDADNKAVTLFADSNAHTSELSGKLAVATPTVTRRATYRGCSSTQQTQLGSAASQAQSYAGGAYSYVPLLIPIPTVK
jgi:peptidyl-Lys metalloendopeptidase